MNAQTLALEQLITEETQIQPLKEVLDQVPKSTPNLQSYEAPNSLKKTLDEMFPEQQHEEKAIKRAKEVLGDKAINLTDVQMRDTVSEVQYLVTTWLDEFERGIFDGSTLQELLHEKGGS